MNKKILAVLLTAVLLLQISSCGKPAVDPVPAGTTRSAATTEETIPEPTTAAESVYRVNAENGSSFRDLLLCLHEAYEDPETDLREELDDLISSIGAVSENDGLLAEAIVQNWYKIFLNEDGNYINYLYNDADAETADVEEELSLPDLPDSRSHALVVLGYALKNGEMTDELKGRCDAAAEAARAFPQTILVCSGGATGLNNPEKHTEAGRMKDYLIEHCGIDAERIFTDERAINTAENAANTFQILRIQHITSITIITSSYHQRWGEVLYHAQAAMEELLYGNSVRIISNYNYDTECPSSFVKGHTWAISQLASMLRLPQEIVHEINEEIGMYEIRLQQ